MKRRVAVLISGRGSNLGALIAAAAAADHPAAIVLVIANVASAPGLAIAEAAGIPTRTIPHRDFPHDRTVHEAAIHAALAVEDIAFVCLAGYMRTLTPFLVERWAGRMLNIHPSLLPAFPGLDTHNRALAAGVALHGCTVHLVTAALDQGPILAQAAIPVRPGDTEAALAARVLAQEHIIYPAALRALIEGHAPLAPPAAALHNHLPRAAPAP